MCSPSKQVFEICFNSRTREGCDLAAAKANDIDFVSIHAPVKGAIKIGSLEIAI